jgi:hypothetical protein
MAQRRQEEKTVESDQPPASSQWPKGENGVQLTTKILEGKTNSRNEEPKQQANGTIKPRNEDNPSTHFQEVFLGSFSPNPPGTVA